MNEIELAEFIQTHGRIPTDAELARQQKRASLSRPEEARVGLARYNVRHPHFGSESSFQDHNVTTRSVMLDLKESEDTLADLEKLSIRKSLDWKYGYQKLMRRLRKLDSQLSVKLLEASDDLLVNKIAYDFEEDANEIGSVKLKQQKQRRVPYEYTLSARSALGIESFGSTGRAQDGDLLAVARSRTDLAIEFVLEIKPQGEINQIKLDLKGNELTAFDVFVSYTTVDGVYAQEVRYQNQSGILNIPLLVSPVSVRLRVVSPATNSISKAHMLSIGELSCLKTRWASTSTVELRLPLKYPATHFSLKMCAVVPVGCEISAFIAGNEQWIPIEDEVVFIGASNEASVIDLIDTGLEENELVASERYPEYALVNSTVAKEDYVGRSLRLFRNKATALTVRSLASGWEETQSTYKCLVRIDGSTVLDLGPQGAWVDGIWLSGTVRVGNGYHSFETLKNNWLTVAEGANSLAELKGLDPLYPHNHKLILDGYRYGSGFRSERLYRGYTHYEKELEYVSELPTSITQYTVRRHENKDSFVLLTTSNDWENERVDVSFRTTNEGVDEAFLKFELKSDSIDQTPELQSIVLSYV